MKALLILIFLSSALIFGGCQKEDSGSTPTKTKSEQIASSPWKYNDAKIDSDNNGTGDVALPAGVIEACQTDNTILFAANGTGTLDEGATKCDLADSQTIPFTWNFTSNESVINFSSAVFAGVGGDFKIISLTDTELILSKQLTVPPIPLPLTVIISFKH